MTASSLLSISSTVQKSCSPRGKKCSRQKFQNFEMTAVGIVIESLTYGFSGGAWPFLVGGLPCQVDSGNERDLSLLNSHSLLGGWQTS